MKKPVIVALCCLLALGTGTAAFAEEPTPTPAPELVELSPEDPAPQFYPDSIDNTAVFSICAGFRASASRANSAL